MISTQSRRIALFGASGQIGSSLIQALSGLKIQSFPWSKDPEFLDQALRTLALGEYTDIVFAGGVTDPRLPEEQISYCNFRFIQKFIQATAAQNFRYLTLGTVMENFPEACLPNPYLRSKLELGRWLSEECALDRIRHVRLHTVYGGRERRFLKPHMFLGQMVAALEARKVFQMSSGEQLREYHHADDIGVSLRAVLEADWRGPGSPFLQINSGEPIRLGDLAKAVFSAFQSDEYLRIGAIPRAIGENLDQVFKRSEPWLLVQSREPIAGVIQWIKEISDVPRSGSHPR